MARLSKDIWKIGFPIVKQAAWGTQLGNADLSQFLTLQQPLATKDPIEFWDDQAQVGKGHNWETTRGIVSRHIEFDLPVQPLPVSAIAMFVALFFSNSTPAASVGAEGYTHTSKFLPLSSLAASWFTSLAVKEDNVDLALVDLAVTSLTLRGGGKNRLECGGSFVATRRAALDAFTFPTAATLNYLWNYSGIFEINDSSKVAQIQGFELTMKNGISMDLAWQKVAAEADRIYPASWPFTTAREVSLSLDLKVDSGDYTAYRTARAAGTEYKLELSCLGDMITSAEARSLLITIPEAVIEEIDESYPEDLLQLSLKFKPHYNTALAAPLSIAITDGTAAYGATEA